MNHDDRPLFVTRKVFMRRLGRRLFASALAMLALNAMSPDGEPDRLRPIVGETTAGPVSASRSLGSDDVAAIAEAYRRPAARAAIPLRRNASAPNDARIAMLRPSPRAAAVPADVVVFDRCLPECDSRDPLLASNRAEVPDPELTPDPEPVSRLAVDAGPNARALEAADGVLRFAYRGIRSLADAGGRSIGSGLEALSPW